MPSNPAIPRWRHPGIVASLAAAALFGAAAPLAKLLLAQVGPWLLAALLYLGSGLGLALWRRLRGQPRVRLAPGEVRWLAGAVAAGGVAGPVLLMLGLAGLPASQASLLLNGEGVFTALLAWFAFRENVDRRVALGMGAIVAGGVVLAWPGEGAAAGSARAALLVLAACLAWAIDNNLTRKVSLSDATWIAMVKGLAAGITNLLLAFLLGATLPPVAIVGAAGLLGFFSYGVSLVLFVMGLRSLGTARTGAYFSVAPFFGAVLSVLLLGDALDWRIGTAAALMACGVWLHLSERHEHRHAHESMDHAHEHVHGVGDEHHDHVHEPPVPPGTRHSHAHHHEPLVHSHPHYPDAHHRHGH
ncbi:DMT family transporter [Ramlibacter alkalitolerans]|uniref:EamA family transporter n=1 Tax=Ramlibacter alkalitolerans TaxID=2039631 RepID=A0ABS1JJ66_9BURK|nr:DMT family transporter [Ramlibacter alkalitolerans]MBL0424268.1 EamA family transporter [Ramlibacter alkalitolerans]